ncbi:hypothetical protein ACFSTC_36970 [Nonomuraea ferruginea]
MPASLALIHEDGTETALPSKGQGSALPGEIVSLRAGGGGGYGDPAERPAELVEADLRDGRITAAGAAAYERTR